MAINNDHKCHFVLVHGSCHGAWCWYHIVDALQKDGHLVTAVDLASAGLHPADANSISSFEQYNQPLVDLFRSLPDTQKVVLVGHSMGGLSLTAAAELFPSKISVAIYVAAVMLRFGFHDEEGIELLVGSFTRQYQEKITWGFGKGPNEPPTTLLFSKDVRELCVCPQSPSKVKVLASMLLRPFPTSVVANGEVKTTDESYGSVPRVYIRTERDEVFAPWKQDKMIKDCPPSDVLSMDSDHSPIFSDPPGLHRLLLQVAAKYS